MLICILLSASVARAEGKWVDEQYVITNPDPEGRGKTLGLATLMGTATGVIFGGLLLAFYWNPDADKNFDVMLITSGSIGCVGGIVLGMTLPPGAAKESAPASIQIDREWSMNLNLPKVSTFINKTPLATERFWHTNLFQVSF